MKLEQNAQGNETKMTFTCCWNHLEAAVVTEAARARVY